MKRFVSDRVWRARITSSLPEMAKWEARRILAETEAGGETFTYGNHRFEGRYLKTELSRDYNRQGCAELAESLAAFIALPIE